MNYDEAWIPLYGMGQKFSLQTGALVKVESKPIVRFDAVLYDRHASFTVSPAEWATVGASDDAQLDLLRYKIADVELRIFSGTSALIARDLSGDANDSDRQSAVDETSKSAHD